LTIKKAYNKSQLEDFEMTQQVLTGVNTFIEEYRKKNGYKLVYAEEGLNTTEKLKIELNRQY